MMQKYTISASDFYDISLKAENTSSFNMSLHNTQTPMQELIQKYNLKNQKILSIAPGSAFEEFWFYKNQNILTFVDIDESGSIEPLLSTLQMTDKKDKLTYFIGDAREFDEYQDKFDTLYISSFTPDELRSKNVDFRNKSTNIYSDIIENLLKNSLEKNGLFINQSYCNGFDASNPVYINYLKNYLLKFGITLLKVYHFKNSPAVSLTIGIKTLESNMIKNFLTKIKTTPDINCFHGRSDYSRLPENIAIFQRKIMYTIAIIGAGQLGSRHLQSVAKSNIKISIEVVEPFESSRTVAQQRFEEIPHNDNVVSIRFLESLQQLSGELDLVVIATNSDVRSSVTLDLLSFKKVKNLVLEKVLFQKEEEYYQIEKALEQSKTLCWVNHPRRMFPFYQTLKSKLSHASRIDFSVSGGGWGLACNGLHFLDVFEYLSGTAVTKIDNGYLDKKILETSRKGYIELSGKLIGNVGQNTFDINCFESPSPLLITITSDILNLQIYESDGWYKIAERSDEWRSTVKEEKIVYYQSELTNKILEDVLTTAKSILPTYKEAMKLHLMFIDTILEHINSFSEIKFDSCSIT